jgi:hypothetical protein
MNNRFYATGSMVRQEEERLEAQRRKEVKKRTLIIQMLR